MLLSVPAEAEPLPDCSSGASIYCDESWHGSAEFVNLFKDRDISWSSVLDEQTIEDDKAIQIWIHPPEIPTETVIHAVNYGARILVLDESQTSINWYQNIHAVAADSINSPDMPTAAHINGNPNLPVLPIDDETRKTFHLPEMSSQWKLAFNHPTPIIRFDPDDTTRLKQILYFAEFAENPDTKGALFVIRDESFATRLMIKTLDNGHFLTALFEKLCDNSSTCPIKFYEPGFSYVAMQSETEQTDERTWISQADEMWTDVQEFATETVDTVRKSQDYIPLKLILFCLIMAWTGLAIVAAFPWRRTKQKS